VLEKEEYSHLGLAVIAVASYLSEAKMDRWNAGVLELAWDEALMKERSD
jgi:hypothetical protein